MLSARLIHLIETHHKEVADRVLREIWRRQDLPHVLRLPEAELRERNRIILEHLGEWLSGNEEEMGKRQESVGRQRFEQSVPLHEAVHALCLIKNTVLEFIEEQGIPRDTLGLYAEEELEHRLGKFFDLLIIHLVRGYEGAWRRALRAAA
jgi:hypothetical protein